MIVLSIISFLPQLCAYKFPEVSRSNKNNTPLLPHNATETLQFLNRRNAMISWKVQRNPQCEENGTVKLKIVNFFKPTLCLFPPFPTIFPFNQMLDLSLKL